MYLNKATVCGNLTRDPELKALPSGTNVVSFSVATNRQVKNKDTDQYEDRVDYHNVVMFGKRAETIQKYFKKGMPIYVEGRMQTQSWEDKESKKKMYRTEVVADDFQFVGRKSDNEGGAAPAASSHAAPPVPPAAIPADEMNPEDINPEDIPF